MLWCLCLCVYSSTFERLSSVPKGKSAEELEQMKLRQEEEQCTFQPKVSGLASNMSRYEVMLNKLKLSYLVLCGHCFVHILLTCTFPCVTNAVAVV